MVADDDQNTKFHLLVDRLEKDFGPEHKVTHYVGAVLPQSVTKMDTFTIAELRDPDVVKQFSTISTLYIPPLPSAIASDDPGMSARLGCSPGVPFGSERSPSRHLEVVSQIAKHVVPPTHKRLHASSAMKRFMIDLIQSPELLEKYKADPALVVGEGEGLTTGEKLALKTGRSGPLCEVMWATPEEISSGVEKSLSEEALKVGGVDPVGLILFFVVTLMPSSEPSVTVG